VVMAVCGGCRCVGAVDYKMNLRWVPPARLAVSSA
jgi:hypothetical protein